MNKWDAICEDCRYKLWNRGQIGTEAFATKHAIRAKHKVNVIGPYGTTTIDNRAIIESETDEPPF